ncbi:MAG: VOC family protein [Pseudomonadota bacterium]
MSFLVYLYFDGDCEEAFAFYKTVFGGEYEAMLRFADGPPDLGVPDEANDLIMHVTLKVGDAVLHGSDTLPDTPFSKGTNFAVSHRPQSREDADRKFAALSEGGVISMDMQEVFWGSYFGMCTDRFGVQWMLNMDLLGRS